MVAKARNPYHDVEQLDSKPVAAECYLSVALLRTARPASRHQEMANVSFEGHGVTWPLLASLPDRPDREFISRSCRPRDRDRVVDRQIAARLYRRIHMGWRQDGAKRRYHVRSGAGAERPGCRGDGMRFV